MIPIELNAFAVFDRLARARVAPGDMIAGYKDNRGVGIIAQAGAP